MQSIKLKLEQGKEKKIKTDKSKKLIYGLSPLPSYDIYSETLKYLLENDMVTLDRIHSAVYTPTDYVFKDFINEMTSKRQAASDLLKESTDVFDSYSKENLAYIRDCIKSESKPDVTYPHITEEDIEKVKNATTLYQKGSSVKEFAKINNNSSFGKTIQSDENFTTSEIVSTSKEFIRKTVGKILIDFNIIAPKTKNHPGTVEFRVKKEKIEIKAPKYLGSAVLWFSKMLMWDFVYNCLYKVFKPEEVNILYTDTDSLYLSFLGENAPLNYEELLVRVNNFNPEFRVRHFSRNEFDITPGVMKCEKEIDESVFLQPKSYCLHTKDDKTVPKAKGSILSQNKELVENINNYKRALDEFIQMKGANIIFKKVDKVNMKTIKQTKYILTPYDNKRRWINKYDSVPWGYIEPAYNPDNIFKRIISNCRAARNGVYTEISEEKFLEYLGCPLEEFRNELEDNMKKIRYCSYMNYGTYWNVDHTIPVDSGKGKEGDELENFLKDICNHKNLVPMLVEENSRKKNKIIAVEKKEPEIIEEEVGDVIEGGNELEEEFETENLILNDDLLLDNIADLTEDDLKYYELLNQKYSKKNDGRM
jgi:hypothetical protein